MIDYEQFNEWLIANTNLSDKSVRDVISRLKRVSTFINLNVTSSKDEIIYKLSQNSNFKSLNMDIRSQLKKAIKLYKEYQDNLLRPK